MVMWWWWCDDDGGDGVMVVVVMLWRGVAQGKSARQGDHIPYVICQGDKPMAERAYHPDVVASAGGALQPDYLW